MRPFGARGSAGEARRLCGSAAGQSPLSLFPWKKRKRFLMVSREKGLAAAFQAPPEMPFPACYGGFGLVAVDGLDHSTAYGSCKSWGRFRIPSASLLLPQSGGCGRLEM